LRILFDQLKQKLKEEGLFDQQHKKSLPSVIKNVVLITSPTGAAVHDFISVCTTRQADLSLQILPVRVQGQGAAEQICRAIEMAHTLAADVIVLCRGGGSLEDLWSYNEESVARAISEATVPLITGIGHETDFTIADFCADFRCATPTAAAELITTDRAAFEEKIASVSSRLLRTMTLLLDRHESRLSRMSDMLSTFDKAFSHHTFAIEHLHTRLHNIMALIIEQSESRFSRMRSHLLHLAPDTAISRHQDRLTFLCMRLQERVQQLVQARQAKLEQSAAVLDTLSPLKTLARGYGIVSKKGQTDGPGTIITSTSQVEKSEEVEVRVHQGALDCRVLRKRN
jgi:exodeoxyribonuclease VII large subunit